MEPLELQLLFVIYRAILTNEPYHSRKLKLSKKSVEQELSMILFIKMSHEAMITCRVTILSGFADPMKRSVTAMNVHIFEKCRSSF